MKKSLYKYLFSVALLGIFGSCTELDLEQQDAASSASWYRTEDQFRQSVNEGYREVYWPQDISTNGFSDDFQRRDALDRITAGTLNSEDGTVATIWSNMYKAITRMLVVENKLQAQDFLSEEVKNQLLGEVNFLKASYWSYLITHFGDVPFYEEELDIQESFEIPRTDKYLILDKIYEYYDFAFSNLPDSYSGVEYATKGAAAAMKARTALYMGDFQTAATAAKSCMDLGDFELYPDYAGLFKSSTKNSVETIFHIPRSNDLNVIQDQFTTQDFVPRNFGGYGARSPTWSLLASYRCIDGLRIDKSPLFDPRNPFKNRDPRCAMTIVPFGSLQDGDGRLPSDGSNFLGIEYTPHPERKTVVNHNTGNTIRNNDTRSVVQYASYNGLLWNKGVDEDWLDFRTDPDLIIVRYADVLLMYAEAKIELGAIDDSVLEAINRVRARAYNKADFPAPVVTETDQDELRRIVRDERRMEFALENLRYMDLIRWGIADEALTGSLVGMLNVSSNPDATVEPTGPLMDKIVDPGLYFWPIVPQYDKNEFLPDMEAFVAQGYARSLNIQNFPDNQYLWPIPAGERLLNPNLTQNPGY